MMWKHTRALLAAAALAASDCRPTAAQASVAPELRARLLVARESVWRAWFANDRTQLEAILPSELIAINNGDTTWQDRAATLRGAAAFARGGGRLLRLEFPRTEIQVYGNVAILYSLWELEIEQQGKRTRQVGRATEIFVRRGGRWLNSGWHLDSGS